METKTENNTKIQNKKENVIYVGKKGVMPYAWAALIQLKSNKDVYIQARGRNISTAVDASQVVCKKLESGAEVRSVEIGTESVVSKEGQKVDVSTISIKISK